MLANNLYPALSAEPNPIVALRKYETMANLETCKVYGAFADLVLFTATKRDSTGWLVHYVGVSRHIKGGTFVYVYESDAPKTL